MILENIKRLCKTKGISIWALERKLGIGNGVIGKWANGSPRVETVKLIADYFGVSVDELLKQDDTGRANQTDASKETQSGQEKGPYRKGGNES